MLSYLDVGLLSSLSLSTLSSSYLALDGHDPLVVSLSRGETCSATLTYMRRDSLARQR